MNFAMLKLCTPSTIRRYVPAHEFDCESLLRTHLNVRGTLRALNSYIEPDRTKGPRYMPLSRIEKWIDANKAHIERVTAADFRHHEGQPCAECRAVIETGFHLRALEAASNILAEEKAKVDAELEIVEVVE